MEPTRLGFHPGAPNLYQLGYRPTARCCSSHRALRRVRNGDLLSAWFSNCILFGTTCRQTKAAVAGFDNRSILGELLDAHAGLGQLT